jgi:tetratricopeptide (TPR) repeat protein
MIQALISQAPELIPWLISAVTMLIAGASFFYAYRALGTADSRLAEARDQEQRLRQSRSRQLIREAQALWQSQPTQSVQSEVLDLVTRAGELDPDNPEVPRARALLMRHAGRLEEAHDAYEAVLALDPGHEIAHHALGKLDLEIAERTATPPPQTANERGKRLLQENRSIEAEKLFRRILHIDPASADAHGGLAAALEAQGIASIDSLEPMCLGSAMGKSRQDEDAGHKAERSCLVDALGFDRKRSGSEPISCVHYLSHRSPTEARVCGPAWKLRILPATGRRALLGANVSREIAPK